MRVMKISEVHYLICYLHVVSNQTDIHYFICHILSLQLLTLSQKFFARKILFLEYRIWRQYVVPNLYDILAVPLSF
jgi:hypothetical protein